MCPWLWDKGYGSYSDMVKVGWLRTWRMVQVFNRQGDRALNSSRLNKGGSKPVQVHSHWIAAINIFVLLHSSTEMITSVLGCLNPRVAGK